MSTSPTQATPTIVLHWLEHSRSQRILWLLEELSLPYTLKTYKRDPATGTAIGPLKDVHPLGKSPTLTIQTGNSPTIVLAESGAIIDYLCSFYGRNLVPPKFRLKDPKGLGVGDETEAWRRFLFYKEYAEASLMPLVTVIFVTIAIKQNTPLLLKPIGTAIAKGIKDGFLVPQFTTHFQFLEQQLATSEGEYLCGKYFNGADIMMSFPLELCADMAGMTADMYPRLTRYLATLKAREAYVRVAKRVETEEGGK